MSHYAPAYASVESSSRKLIESKSAAPQVCETLSPLLFTFPLITSVNFNGTIRQEEEREDP